MPIYIYVSICFLCMHKHMFIEQNIFTGYCSTHFTNKNLLSLNNNPVRCVIIIPILKVMKSRHSEKVIAQDNYKVMKLSFEPGTLL